MQVLLDKFSYLCSHSKYSLKISDGTPQSYHLRLPYFSFISVILYNILSENTGKTFEEIEQDADRDHWLMADEALPGVYGKFGLIDEIVGKKK